MTEPANWPAYFFAILGGALLVLNFVKGISRKPPIEAEFATKAELKEGLSASRSELHGGLHAMGGRVDDVVGRLERGMERLGEKLDVRVNDLLLVDERRTKELHERINKLAEMVSRLDERTQ